MKEAEIKLEILTSMYSHGSNKTKMEFRITELKSLLRTTLRELYEFKNLEHMKEVESSLFGDQEHRSPVSFRMKKGEDISNINSGRNITFIIRSNHLDEYITLLLQAAIIGSLGAKSRKGKGSFRVVNIMPEDNTDNQKLIKVLDPNKIFDETISIQGCKIRKLGKSSKLNSPYLKKLKIIKIENIKNDYEKVLDNVKASIGKPSDNVEKKILGSINPRFASAIWISIWENVNNEKYLIVKELNYDYFIVDKNNNPIVVKMKATRQYVNQYVNKLIELGGK